MPPQKKKIRLNKKFYSLDIIKTVKRRFECIARFEILEEDDSYSVLLTSTPPDNAAVLEEFANHCLAESR